jgi:hypothetical protein
MKQLHSFYFWFVHMAAHYEFFIELEKALTAAGSTVQHALADLTPSFHTWLDKEAALMLWVRKSILTEEITAANRQINHTLVGINAAVRAARYAADKATVDAADNIRIMLKNYGRVTHKPYSDKSGDLDAMLRLFATEYAADAATVGLQGRIAELQAAFNRFERFLRQRNTEYVKKPDYTFRDVRRGIEAVYHKMATIIDAGSTLNASPDFAALIDKLNPKIDRFNATFIPVKHRIATTKPDGIEPQPHTGEPVTPTPAIYYTDIHGKTVKLALGRDYNLSYKDNIKPGTARCIFHGKGKFTGSKFVTFVIND